MKKKLFVPAGIVLAFIVAAAGLNAATRDEYLVKVTVVEASTVSINILNTDIDLNGGKYVIKGSSIICDAGERTITENTSGVNVTYKMRITGQPAGWSAGTASLSDNGVDKYVLATVFHVWNSSPAWSDYGDDDVLSTTDKTASPAAGGMFVDNTQDAPDDAASDGYDVAPTQQVSNFYFFKAPTSLSSTQQYGTQQSIVVTITAVEQP